MYKDTKIWNYVGNVGDKTMVFYESNQGNLAIAQGFNEMKKDITYGQLLDVYRSCGEELMKIDKGYGEKIRDICEKFEGLEGVIIGLKDKNLSEPIFAT
jgi:hypothetical protein